MTALAFIETICKLTGLVFEFTSHYGKVSKSEYIRLIFRCTDDPSSEFILWYTIQGDMPLSGDCSVCGQFAESDDNAKAKACLWPLIDALNNHASLVKLTLCSNSCMDGRTTLFSVAGKSCDEIIVKIDLHMKQQAEI